LSTSDWMSAAAWVLLQEYLKAFPLYRFDAVFIEPLLRERKAIPADERCRQGDLLPLGMKGQPASNCRIKRFQKVSFVDQPADGRM
jgi:hypothetical protein